MRIADGRIEFIPLPSPDPRVTTTVSTIVHYNGNLWVGSNQGLEQYVNGRFVPFKALAGRSIETLLVDDAGTLWVATTHGLYRLRGDRFIERIENEDVLDNLWNRAMLEDRSGDLWLGSQSGRLVRIWDGNYTLYGHFDGLPNHSVWTLAADGGPILAGTEDGVAALADGHFSEMIPGRELPSPVVGAIMRDQAGNLWIGTTLGLAAFKDGKPALRQITASAPHTRYYVVAEDRQGRIWAGSSAGVVRADPSHDLGFKTIEGLGGAAVRDIQIAKDGAVWIATARGVFRYADDKLAPVDSRFGLRTHKAIGIHFAAGGDIWLSYLDEGLIRIHGEKFEHYTAADGLPANLITHVADSADGMLWLSTFQAVATIPLKQFDELDAGKIHALHPRYVVTATATEPGSQTGQCCHGGTHGSGLMVAGKTLYLPTVNGVMAIDTARFKAPLVEPPARIESLTTSQHAFPATDTSIRLAADERDLTIHYAALDFRYPDTQRFRYRMLGYDHGWVEAGTRRTAYYTNLDPGDYTFQVTTALGDDPQASAATVRIHVDPRFTETSTFYVLVAFIMFAFAYTLHRLWTYQLYRHQRRLEQTVEQRTRELSELNQRLLQANRKLEEQSLTDSLTGLHNRRFLDIRVYENLARLKGAELERMQIGLCLIIDIDFFKQVNDRYGHASGDTVLREFSQLLVEHSRPGDPVVRLGGEEFLLIAHAPDLEDTRQIAARLCEAVRGHVFKPIEGVELRLTCSIGYAPYPFDPATPDDLSFEEVLTVADQALYEAKESGRDRFVGVEIFPGTLASEVRKDLHRGLDYLVSHCMLRLMTAEGRHAGPRPAPDE